MKVSLLILLISIIMCAVQSVTVRETDGPILNINLPIEPETLNDFLPPGLVADLYNSTAYVSVMVTQITQIEMKIPIVGGWIPTMPSNVWLVKTYVPVHCTITNRIGYLILSMDFQDSFLGWFQSEGCSSTQTGVLCSKVKSFAANGATPSSKVDVENKDGSVLKFSYTTASAPSADPNFVSWLVNRTYKYELGKEGHTTEAQQSGKNIPQNFQGFQSVRVEQWVSSMLSVRFPKISRAEENAQLCTRGECFWSPSLQFIDTSGSPIN